jgi:hypothetical protein
MITTDSLAQFDTHTKEFADSLFRAVKVVSDNTNSFDGISGVVTWISFAASTVTIIGLLLVCFEIYTRGTNVRCQKKIIFDLIRHLFTNNAISEVMRLKYPEFGKNTTLSKGIFLRYCVLDSDIELGQLSYSDRNYEMLHSLRLKLRNYNIAAQAAEEHWTDPICPIDIKMADLDDILHRSKKISEDFIEFSKSRRLRINHSTASQYIREYYEKRIPKWKEENKIDYSIKIPNREGENAYYDGEDFKLKEIEDTLIRERYSYVKFVKSVSVIKTAPKATKQ